MPNRAETSSAATIQMTTQEPKTEPTVAEALIEVRTSLGLSRAEAARNSGVPKKYIEFLEGDKTDGITADIYAHHKLRVYSRYLNLDEKKVLSAYRKENTKPEAPIETRHASRWRKHPLKHIPTSRLIVAPNIIRTAIVVAIAIGIGMFFVVRTQRMMAPPNVNLVSPPDGLVTVEKSLTVMGRTEREVTLLVNGKPVYIDTSGNFTDQLVLREGLNVIRVVAIRKHGQETEVTRRVIVKPADRPTASLELYAPVE